jgi:protein SCO1/2
MKELRKLRNQRPRTLWGILLFLILCLPAAAQRADQSPEELEGVDIVEHLGETIPLDLSFTDEDGKEITLRDYFHKGRPVILTLNYYSCPMLCTLQLNGLVDTLQELQWTPGQEFEIVTATINPRETPQLAKLKKQNYIKDYGRPSAASGWHFLTGKEENIKKLADAVGFEYKYDEKTNQYIHAAALIILTPEGKIGRYLYGVMYEPKTLRLSLLETSEGEIGSTLDRFVLYCFHYDAEKGTYAPAAMNIVRAVAILTASVLGILLISLWLREARKTRHPAEEPQS